MEIIEFSLRIMKIMKKKQHRIPYENHETNENLSLSCENHEKLSNLRIPLDNHENHENHTIRFENHENHEILAFH